MLHIEYIVLKQLNIHMATNNVNTLDSAFFESILMIQFIEIEQKIHAVQKSYLLKHPSTKNLSKTYAL